MWISSHNLQTSIPTVDLVLVSCSDRSLPCMRDLLPIICSGQEPRSGRTTLTDGAPSQGGIRSRPLAPGTAAAVPGAQSLCSESPNDPPSESAKSTYKGAFPQARTRGNAPSSPGRIPVFARCLLTSPRTRGEECRALGNLSKRQKQHTRSSLGGLNAIVARSM